MITDREESCYDHGIGEISTVDQNIVSMLWGNEHRDPLVIRYNFVARLERHLTLAGRRWLPSPRRRKKVRKWLL